MIFLKPNPRKRLLLLCAIIAVLTTNNTQAQSFVAEDFNSITNPNLPVGWGSVPSAQWVCGAPDMITPGALSQQGFSLTTADHSKAVGIDGSQQSADNALLALPAISLPASATDAVLNFDVAFLGAENNGIFESLVLEVSTDGGTNWSLVAFINQISNPFDGIWETRSLSLGAYAGQSNLKFGFRYHNQGNVIVGAVLDNIRIISGADGSVIAALAGHTDPATGISYQESGTTTTLRGTVKNTGTDTINAYYIKYTVGNGAEQSSALMATTLPPSATENFPPGLMVNIPGNISYPVKVWIEVAGDINQDNDTALTTTIGLPHIPEKRPVFEEGTGTWCGWCPRGAVFMEHFASTHPNGNAAQIAVHNNDPMTLNDYDAYMAHYNTGYPNIIVDRLTQNDPKDIDSIFAEVQNNFGFADITIGTPIITGNRVALPVTIKPVVAISNPKLALVITESNVQGSGSGWPQNNYYSGGGSDPMDGWEDEAPHVDNVNFNFVARSISPAPAGATGNLPAILMPDATYTDTLHAILDSAWQINDLQYIALLINGDNGSILNSAFTALPTLRPSLGNSTAIKNIDNESLQAVLYPNPACNKTYLNVITKHAGMAEITVSDMTGRRLTHEKQKVQAGKNIIEIETNNLSAGSYFIHFTTGAATAHLKLQVTK